VRTAWPFKLPEPKASPCKAWTVDKIWLDEFHGLRFSVRGFEGMWPLTLTDFGAQTPVDNQHDPYAAADSELGRT